MSGTNDELLWQFGWDILEVIIAFPRASMLEFPDQRWREMRLCLMKGSVSFLFVLRLTNTEGDLSRILSISLYRGKAIH